MEGRWNILRGLLALAAGAFAFARPGQFFAAVLSFAALAVAAGILAIVHAFRLPAGRGAGRWVLAVEGAAGVALGWLTFAFVRQTIFLAYTLGAWAIAAGAGTFALAVLLRGTIRTAWLWALLGALAAGLGFGLLLNPAAASLGPSYVLGSIATLVGVVQIATGFGILRHQRAGAPVSTS